MLSSRKLPSPSSRHVCTQRAVATHCTGPTSTATLANPRARVCSTQSSLLIRYLQTADADPDQTEPRPLFNQPPTTAQHHATTPWMWTQTTWRRKIRTRNPTSSEVYSLQTQNIIVCIILYPDESILVGGSKDHEDDFFLTGPKINMSGLRQQFEQEST